MEIRVGPNGERGIFAVGAVPPGEIIVSLPVSCVLSSEVARTEGTYAVATTHAVEAKKIYKGMCRGIQPDTRGGNALFTGGRTLIF